MDDVVKFPGRARPLAEADALARLREAGVTKAASIAELGRSWGWERSRTSKAVIRWESAGHIIREAESDGIVIRVPGVVPAVPGDGPAGKRPVPAGSTASGDVPTSGPGCVRAVPVPTLEAAVVPALQVERPLWREVPAGRPAKPDVITLLVALSLAAVSAGFSIYGMTSIFIGAFWSVIALGVVLELGKLRAVALIGMGRGKRRLRAALVGLVAVLMGLNAIGDYGFLAKAHIGHQVERDVAVAARVADITAGL